MLRRCWAGTELLWKSILARWQVSIQGSAAPHWVSASEGARTCGFEWSCPSAALRPDGRYHSPMEKFQGSETNKISSKEEMLWLYCFATLENVSFYFENCFLWFAVRDQTVSLDLFPRHTVLGNFTFTFECKLLESVSSLAWNSKIKSKWDGFLWNEKAISLLISCNLVMSYSDKCFYYVLS